MNNTPNKAQDPITHNASPTTQVPNKAAQKDAKKAPVASLAQKKGEDGKTEEEKKKRKEEVTKVQATIVNKDGLALAPVA